MSNNTQIETLLKNIQQGLKKYSVNELNVALIKALSENHNKSGEIEYLIKLVCEEFDISEYALKHMEMRGKMQDCKHIAFCLLHFHVGLSIRYISRNVFFNGHTSVANGIKRFKKCNLEIKQDKEFLEKYHLLKFKLSLFIKEQTNK